MRSVFMFSAVLALTLGGAFSAHAGALADALASTASTQKTAQAATPADVRATVHLAAHPASLPQSDGLLDVLAAEFFESTLRLAQSRQIEAETAKRYLAMDAEGRAQYRAERKKLWRDMSADQHAALRGVKRPTFANLDNAQKQTFRRIASEALGAAPSLGNSAARSEI